MAKTAPKFKKIPLKSFHLHGRCEFWRGRYSSVWNSDIYTGSTAYYNVDLQIIVCQAPTQEDILIPVPGIMKMVADAA